MKRILTSLIVVLALVVSVSAATQAVFSATGSVAGNTVSTGTLKISINHTAGKPWSVTNMGPGDKTNWEWMDVINVGSLPATYYFYLDNATGTPDWNLWNNLKIELRNPGNGGANDYENCTVANSKEIYNGPVSGVYSAGSKINTTDFAYGSGSQMPAGWSQRICQRVYLESTVGNEVQSRSTGFDEVMYAEQ